jgi:hypothetical protein
MTAEEILGVWSFYDDSMTEKFYSGLSMKDIYSFTNEEWKASLLGFGPSEFKARFFDRMDIKGIMFVSKKLA